MSKESEEKNDAEVLPVEEQQNDESEDDVKNDGDSEVDGTEDEALENDEGKTIEEVEPEDPFAIFSFALVRLPAPTAGEGITGRDLGRAEYGKLLEQHLSYTAVLRSLGLEIRKLPSLPEYPDAHFIEDVAVITPEVAVITRPGAESRRGEIEHIQEALEEHRPLARIEEPGTLEGGDVMRIDMTFYIGLSERTNEAGAKQLADILVEFGYTTHIIALEEGLHLKSNVNYIGKNTLLLTAAWANHPLFAAYEKIIVPEEEAYAANTLLVNGRLLTPMGFSETHTILREAGFEILEIDATELQKMDGGLSCLSLRF